MKRKLIDLVDSLHKTEKQELLDGMKELKPEMKHWQELCEEPVFLDVFVANKLKVKGDQQKEDDLSEAIAAMCDITARRKEKLKELYKISKEYKIFNAVKNLERPSDPVLTTQFAYGISNAYMEYKKNSNMNRTFVNC